MKTVNTFIFLLGLVSLSAQLPVSDLYMFTILNNGEKVSLKEPLFLSGFNRGGYNNQPCFFRPNEVFITTNYYDKKYTDFVSLNLVSQELTRITATDSISEYSPTPNAMSDNFSAVRVEQDGVTQTLWLYPNDHKDGGERLFSKLSNIGYHCWLSEKEVALFLLEKTMNLHIGNAETSETKVIAENIGRCMSVDEDGRLIFIQKATPNTWNIKAYDHSVKKAVFITQTLPGSEDFVILSDGTYISGKGSKLYSYHPQKDSQWVEIDDLAEYGITNVTRLASSRNKLVIVDNP